MGAKRWVIPSLLVLLLLSGWAWFYAIPYYKAAQEKQQMADFFGDTQSQQ